MDLCIKLPSSLIQTTSWANLPYPMSTVFLLSMFTLFSLVTDKVMEVSSEEDKDGSVYGCSTVSRHGGVGCNCVVHHSTTVEPPNNGQVGDEHLSIVQRLSILRR